MIQFSLLHPKATQEHLGLIPEFLCESDGRPAAQQFSHNYSHGGGWRPMKSWKIHNLAEHSIRYPGDKVLKPIASAKLMDEIICIYEHAWVGIFQPDGSFEISRMD